MRKIKILFMSIMLITTTISFTGCGGGEADYSFEDVLNGLGIDLVTGTVAFDIPDYYVIQKDTKDITVISTEQNGKDKFSIVGGKDSSLFIIDSNTGKLTFIDSAVVGTFDVVIGVTRNGELSTFTLEVDVVEDITKVEPIIDYVVSQLDVVISDGILTQIKARPADANSALTFSLDDNKSLFLINDQGEITLVANKPDYKDLTETTFELNVIVTDDHNNSTLVGPIVLTLVENADLIRPIVETSAISVIENSLGTTEIQVKSLGTGVVNKYILDGIDKEFFTLSSTGVLAFIDAHDYETLPNTFNITVQIGDDNDNLSEVQAIVVTVSDLDETFVFQGDNDYTPMEGSKSVATVTATPKLEALTLPPQYSLVLGGDLLKIDAQGNLQFIGTAQKGQTVTVQVRVKSELNGSETFSTVFVVDVQDDPSKIKPTISYVSSVTQNDAVNEAISVTTVTATPEGSSTSINYTVEGTDKDMFIIDNFGKIFFNNGSGSYARQDADQNNIYEIYVVVEDNNGNANQTGTIKITIVVNETITLDNIADMTIDEDTALQVYATLFATSAQGYAITYGALPSTDMTVIVNSTTGTLSLDGNNPKIFGTTTYTITVYAEDNYGNRQSQNISIEIKN